MVHAAIGRQYSDNSTHVKTPPSLRGGDIGRRHNSIRCTATAQFTITVTYLAVENREISTLPILKTYNAKFHNVVNFPSLI
jgi:hypothetical protein